MFIDRFVTGIFPPELRILLYNSEPASRYR